MDYGPVIKHTPAVHVHSDTVPLFIINLFLRGLNKKIMVSVTWLLRWDSVYSGLVDVTEWKQNNRKIMLWQYCTNTNIVFKGFDPKHYTYTVLLLYLGAVPWLPRAGWRIKPLQTSAWFFFFNLLLRINLDKYSKLNILVYLTGCLLVYM